MAETSTLSDSEVSAFPAGTELEGTPVLSLHLALHPFMLFGSKFSWNGYVSYTVQQTQ